MGREPQPSPEREARLIADVQRGDRGALGELLGAYERRVYHVCLRMVGSADDAAELTQEALLRAIQHSENFKGEAKFSTWLMRIAMNLCITHLRKSKVRGSLSLDHTGPSGDGEASPPLKDLVSQNHEPSPDSRVQESEQLDRLARAVERLDPDLRGVILLRDLQGMEYQQVAEVLSVPVGTVKSRLFRARLALRTAMEPAERPRTTEVSDG